MHICVVGTGASGWMVAHAMTKLKNISKVTVVGTDKIPSIGVGESTTRVFMKFLYDTFGFTLNEPTEEFNKFLVSIDAAFKYGVSYRNWSPKEFLHVFGPWEFGGKITENYKLLGKKLSADNVNDYTNPVIPWVYNNEIDITQGKNKKYFPHAIHFDANKLIKVLQNIKNDKLNLILNDQAVDLLYDGEVAKTLVLESGRKIEADYFISCIGQTAFNQKVFRETYKSYNDVLLTDTAIAGPIQYTDKRKQFHPYTVAKTMKYGWRWITPTWSRIGTGYVFSSKYVSVDEVINELQSDIGDNTFETFKVDFSPRKVENTFKRNTCTIGMAGGFLEPLDAPGLAITYRSIYMLQQILQNDMNIKEANERMNWWFDFWTAFILLQYKTSHRNDTQFWNDQKNVKFDMLENLYNEIVNDDVKKVKISSTTEMEWETNMFYNTISGKDINWYVSSDAELIKLNKANGTFVNHYEYFSKLHELYGDK
jgi:tryptophan halogenase